MERMTYRLKDQYGNPTDKIIVETDYTYMSTPKKQEVVLSRLAAIEDILGDEYDLDELKEMVQAKREGRCVVLPCKNGDPVWRLYDDCDFPGDCYTKQKCRGCEYRNLFIEEQAFCLSMLSQNGKLNPPYYTTRAEAEAALRREQDGQGGRA